MREHTEFSAHVVRPDDIGVELANFHGRSTRRRHSLALILQAVVAICHAIHIETDNLSTVGDDVSKVAVDRSR